MDALHAGRRFTVWDDRRLNTIATPKLATDAAELIWRALERGVIGTLQASAASTSTAYRSRAARSPRSGSTRC